MHSRNNRAEIYHRYRQEAERDLADALMSLDVETIERMARRWGLTLPLEPLLFWLVVHKARAALRSIPPLMREYSKEWLLERGYRPLDEG